MDIQEYNFHTPAVALNVATGPASGPPLLLLHGGSARWQSFETLIPELAARWHVTAPDLRGHGRSGRTSGRYRLQDYADDVLALLGHLGRPVGLFGHSLGGGVALLAAAQAPESVWAAAVGDSPLSAETWHAAVSPTFDRLAAWRDLAGGQQPLEAVIEALKDAPVEVPGQDEPVPMREVYGEEAPVFDWLATNLVQNDPDMLSMLLEDFGAFAAGYEVERVLPAVRCPVLLLQADPASGGLMTDAEVARALPLLAQPTHVRLEGVNHPLHHTHPEPVLRALTDFFGSVVDADR
jgi:pimeloyl-ACP methyl ester carboxylesterase